MVVSDDWSAVAADWSTNGSTAIDGRRRWKLSIDGAVREREPAPTNLRDQFVTGVLGDNGIHLVPLAGLRKWAHDVAPALRSGA